MAKASAQMGHSFWSRSWGSTLGHTAVPVLCNTCAIVIPLAATGMSSSGSESSSSARTAAMTGSSTPGRRGGVSLRYVGRNPRCWRFNTCKQEYV
jgi:hypothetical protein